MAPSASGQALPQALAVGPPRRVTSPAQVALAWVCAQAGRVGVTIAPVVGTTRPDRVEEYLGAYSLDVAALHLDGQA